jgi:hypothetical protein
MRSHELLPSLRNPGLSMGLGNTPVIDPCTANPRSGKAMGSQQAVIGRR